MYSGYNMPQMTKKVLLTAAQKKIMYKLRNTEETLTNEELTTVLRLNEQTKPSSSPSYGYGTNYGVQLLLTAPQHKIMEKLMAGGTLTKAQLASVLNRTFKCRVGRQ